MGQRLKAFFSDVVFKDADRTGGWFDIAANEAHQSCFSGTVRTEQSHDFSAFEREIDIADRLNPAKVLGQFFYNNHQISPACCFLIIVSKLF